MQRQVRRRNIKIAAASVSGASRWINRYGRKFHIIGVAVCTNEKQNDFAFLFRSVTEGAQLLLGEAVIKPQMLVSAPSVRWRDDNYQVVGSNVYECN